MAEWWEREDDPAVWGSFGSQQDWERQYQAEHGRYPGQGPGETYEEAMRNLMWSQAWAQQHGRGPSQDEWVGHYYRPQDYGDYGQYARTARSTLLEMKEAWERSYAQPPQQVSPLPEQLVTQPAGRPAMTARGPLASETLGAPYLPLVSAQPQAGGAPTRQAASPPGRRASDLYKPPVGAMQAQPVMPSVPAAAQPWWQQWLQQIKGFLPTEPPVPQQATAWLPGGYRPQAPAPPAVGAAAAQRPWYQTWLERTQQVPAGMLSAPPPGAGGQWMPGGYTAPPPTPQPQALQRQPRPPARQAIPDVELGAAPFAPAYAGAGGGMMGLQYPYTQRQPAPPPPRTRGPVPPPRQPDASAIEAPPRYAQDTFQQGGRMLANEPLIRHAYEMISTLPPELQEKALTSGLPMSLVMAIGPDMPEAEVRERMYRMMQAWLEKQKPPLAGYLPMVTKAEPTLLERLDQTDRDMPPLQRGGQEWLEGADESVAGWLRGLVEPLQGAEAATGMGMAAAPEIPESWRQGYRDYTQQFAPGGALDIQKLPTIQPPQIPDWMRAYAADAAQRIGEAWEKAFEQREMPPERTQPVIGFGPPRTAEPGEQDIAGLPGIGQDIGRLWERLRQADLGVVFKGAEAAGRAGFELLQEPAEAVEVGLGELPSIAQRYAPEVMRRPTMQQATAWLPEAERQKVQQEPLLKERLAVQTPEQERWFSFALRNLYSGPDAVEATYRAALQEQPESWEDKQALLERYRRGLETVGEIVLDPLNLPIGDIIGFSKKARAGRTAVEAATRTVDDALDAVRAAGAGMAAEATSRIGRAWDTFKQAVNPFKVTPKAQALADQAIAEQAVGVLVASVDNGLNAATVTRALADDPALLLEGINLGRGRYVAGAQVADEAVLATRPVLRSAIENIDAWPSVRAATWDPSAFMRDLGNNMIDAAYDLRGVTGEVSAVKKLAQAQRALMSEVYLNLNPGYWVRNAVSAIGHMFVDGEGTFKPMSQIDDFWKRLGVSPQRVREAIGGAALRPAKAEELGWLGKSKLRKLPVIGEPLGAASEFGGRLAFQTIEEGMYKRASFTPMQRFLQKHYRVPAPALDTPIAQAAADALKSTLNPREMGQTVDQIITAARQGRPGAMLNPVSVLDDPDIFSPTAVQEMRNVMARANTPDEISVDALRRAVGADTERITKILDETPEVPGRELFTELTRQQDMDDAMTMAERVVRLGASQGDAEGLLRAIATSDQAVAAAEEELLRWILQGEADPDRWLLFTVSWEALDQAKTATRQAVDEALRVVVDTPVDARGPLWPIYFDNSRQGYERLAADAEAVGRTMTEWVGRLDTGESIEQVLQQTPRRLTEDRLNRLLQAVPEELRMEGAVEEAVSFEPGRVGEQRELFQRMLAGQRYKVDQAKATTWDFARQNPDRASADILTSTQRKVDREWRWVANKLEAERKRTVQEAEKLWKAKDYQGVRAAWSNWYSYRNEYWKTGFAREQWHWDASTRQILSAHQAEVPDALRALDAPRAYPEPMPEPPPAGAVSVEVKPLDTEYGQVWQVNHLDEEGDVLKAQRFQSEESARAAASRYATHPVSEGIVDVSQQQTLGTALSGILRPIGEPMPNMVLGGEERLVKRGAGSVDVKYAATGNVIHYRLDVTTSEKTGAGRIVAIPAGRTGPPYPGASEVVKKVYTDDTPDAALVYRQIDGKPTIVDVQVREDVQGKGLGTALVKQFGEQFGEIRGIGPVSQQGKRLMERFPEGLEIVDVSRFPEYGPERVAEEARRAPAMGAAAARTQEFTRYAREFVGEEYLAEGEDVLYHVTTAADKVRAEGLKPRSATGQVGLGGGYKDLAPDMISTTFDEPAAQAIYERLLLASKAARKEVDAAAVLDAMGDAYNDNAMLVAEVLGLGDDIDVDDWETLIERVIEQYSDSPYRLLQELDDGLEHISGIPAEAGYRRVGLTASETEMAAVDPSQIDILEIQARKGAQAEHVADEFELRFRPQDVRVYGPERVAQLDAAREALGNSAAPQPGQIANAVLDAQERALQQIVDAVRDQWTALEGAVITPAEERAIRTWLAEVVVPNWQQTVNAGMNYATDLADFIMLDYNDRNQVDELLSLFVPYHYWYTRSIKNWADRTVSRPGLLSNYMRYRQEIERRRVRTEAPDRFGGTIPLTNEYYLRDPVSLLIPYAQFGPNPYADDPRVRGGENWPQWLRRQAEKWGFGLLPIWEIGLRAISGEEEEWTGGWKEAAVEEAASLGRTDILRGVTAGAGIGPPGGVDIERGVRKAMQLPEYERADLYRIFRAMDDMENAGDITHEDLLEAQTTRSGPVWDKALKRANVQMAIPKVSSLATGLSVYQYPPEERARREIAAKAGQAPSRAAYLEERYGEGVAPSPFTAYPALQEGWSENELNKERLRTERDTLHERINAAIDEAIRQDPGNLQAVRDLESQRYEALEALEAKYPVTPSEPSTYKETPEEATTRQQEEQLRELAGTKPAFPEAGTDEEIAGYYDQLKEWEVNLPDPQAMFRYQQRHDTVEMAAAATWKKMIYDDAFRGLREGGSWEETVGAVGPVTGIQLVPLIVELYGPERFSQQELASINNLQWPSAEEVYERTRPEEERAFWDTYNGAGAKAGKRKIPLVAAIVTAAGAAAAEDRGMFTPEQYKAATMLMTTELGKQGTPQEWAAAEAQYEAWQSLMLERFGKEILNIQSAYFDAGPKGSQARRSYLTVHPELKAMWDEHDRWKASHPLYVKYYDPDWTPAYAGAGETSGGFYWLPAAERQAQGEWWGRGQYTLENEVPR